MVTSAAARGRTTSAKTVQASQVFSQAHFRAYFMGIVKLAFVTPAMMRVAIPHDVLLMIGVLPRSFSCYRFDTRQRSEYSRSSPEGLKADIGRVAISTGFYHAL